MNEDYTQYFDFNVGENYYNCAISLKKEYKKNNLPSKMIKSKAKNVKFVPVSGLNYFQHHLGNVLGKQVYEWRKQYFNKHKLLELFESKMLIPEGTALKWLTEKKEIISIKVTEAFKDPVHKQNLINGLNSESRLKKFRKSMKDNVESGESKKSAKKRIETMKINGTYEHWVKTQADKFANIVYTPELRKKRSDSTKLMWKNADEEKIKRMLPVSSARNYTLNGIKFNLNEYKTYEILLKYFNCDDIKCQKFLKFNNKHCFADFLIQKFNLVIESKGVFWHADPKRFNENDIVFENITANDIWKKDKERENLLIENGYNIIIVWENKYEKFENDIKEFLNDKK